MKSLTITDLARTEQLDRATMTTVRGGWNVYAPSYKSGDVTYAPSYDSSINALQNLGQQQSVLTATANDSAFLSGIDVHNTTRQTGTNKISG